MGIANVAWQYPTSFRRRCRDGEETVILLENTDDGLAAFASTGARLFVLEHDKEHGFKMLDRKKESVLMTRPGSKKHLACVEDKTGRTLSVLEKQSLLWEDASYAWKPKGLLSIMGDTIFELRRTSGQSVSRSPLATLTLHSDGALRTTELKVKPTAENLPLNLLIFQALMLEHQWSSFKITLKPLKQLAFSSRWL